MSQGQCIWSDAQGLFADPRDAASLELTGSCHYWLQNTYFSVPSSSLGSHKPELCPSQSSCRKRKRSQVNSSSCRTFSPAEKSRDYQPPQRVPPSVPTSIKLACQSSIILNQNQSQIITTPLSEAHKTMRLADRCTFSLSEKNIES